MLRRREDATLPFAGDATNALGGVGDNYDDDHPDEFQRSGGGSGMTPSQPL